MKNSFTTPLRQRGAMRFRHLNNAGQQERIRATKKAIIVRPKPDEKPAHIIALEKQLRLEGKIQ